MFKASSCSPFNCSNSNLSCVVRSSLESSLSKKAIALGAFFFDISISANLAPPSIPKKIAIGAFINFFLAAIAAALDMPLVTKEPNPPDPIAVKILGALLENISEVYAPIFPFLVSQVTDLGIEVCFFSLTLSL